MILAIDTATRWLGLALHDSTAVIAETGWRCLNNHTIELAPAIRAMLRHGGIAAADLDGIAVAIGPGSYTGLRVGLAEAKGLSLANGTPLLGVPTLDIVAASFGPLPDKLAIIAEAGRSRIVAGLYEWVNGRGWQAEDRPVVATWQEFLAGLDGRITFAGEITPEAAKQIRAAGKRFQVVSAADLVRRAGYLADIGWQRLRKGQTDDAASLAPIYLKDPAGRDA
jgi:tRNA threonylcarbamoyladenosine biosynthesis protein TsaB